MARAGPSNAARKPSPAVDLAAPILRELLADGAVVTIEKLAPPAVTESRRRFGRTHDIGEHYRRQDSIRLWPMTDACEKFLNLAHDGFGVADERKMICSR